MKNYYGIRSGSVPERSYTAHSIAEFIGWLEPGRKPLIDLLRVLYTTTLNLAINDVSTILKAMAALDTCS